MISPDHARLHAFILGHVQGVGFRAFVRDRAEELDLTGWVRNTFAGDVEVCAEGPREDLERLRDWLRTGPRGSFITELRQEWEPPTDEFTYFEIVRTA
jgi:acylphosphatase